MQNVNSPKRPEVPTKHPAVTHGLLCPRAPPAPPLPTPPSPTPQGRRRPRLRDGRAVSPPLRNPDPAPPPPTPGPRPRRPARPHRLSPGPGPPPPLKAGSGARAGPAEAAAGAGQEAGRARAARAVSTFQSQQVLLLGLVDVHGASLHPYGRADGPKRCRWRKTLGREGREEPARTARAR